jgi:hypothetical protein
MSSNVILSWNSVPGFAFAFRFIVIGWRNVVSGIVNAVILSPLGYTAEGCPQKTNAFAKAATMRFGLTTLLIAMGVVGVALFLLLAAPSSLAVPFLVLISVGLTAFVTAGLVYGNGNTRAFCIGAMIPV